MSLPLLVTGTDTGVGKTFVTCELVRSLRKEGIDAVGYKPVCCGDRNDAELLLEASENEEPIEAINPVWYQAPVTPSVAAELESKPVPLEDIRSHAESMAERHEVLVMEGVGGWEVPMNGRDTFADLAEALGWPVVMVVANRLGALNHTLLTEHAIRDRGLPLVGVILNHLTEDHDIAMTTNRVVLEDLLAAPVSCLENGDGLAGSALIQEVLEAVRNGGFRG
ncbi:MAG TPA: dethiobiotin synthase [Verrucomicrobiales bacterium]|nr:dethiobiotin synthase [Verrucomicrobiales bacterium]